MDIRVRTNSANKRKIDMKRPDELSYWADHFEITNVQLKAAVNAAGTSVKAVEAYLSKR